MIKAKIIEKVYKKIFIGFFAGIICGLFSVGGGMILVPAFLYLLNMDDKEARATSLFCVLPMVIISGIFYSTKSIIDWKLGLYCAIGGIIGGIIGAKSLKKIPTIYLKIAFDLLLFWSSIKMILK